MAWKNVYLAAQGTVSTILTTIKINIKGLSESSCLIPVYTYTYIFGCHILHFDFCSPLALDIVICLWFRPFVLFNSKEFSVTYLTMNIAFNGSISPKTLSFYSYPYGFGDFSPYIIVKTSSVLSCNVIPV